MDQRGCARRSVCAGIVAVFAGKLSGAFGGIGQELFNATILGTAVVMLTWHNVWMARHGRELAAQMRAVGEAVVSGTRPLTALAVLHLTTLVLVSGPASAAQRTVTLAVDNMMCAACPYTVKHSLAHVPGVSIVVVSFEKETATVTYDDQKTTVAALTNATTQAGYPSRPVQ